MPEDAPPEAPKIAVPGSQEAVKPQSPEQKMETAWSKFMDVMEEKVSQTGQYFLSLGGERANGVDDRAFILIKPVFNSEEGTARYVVISRKGARGASQKDVESRFKGSLDSVRKGLPQPISHKEEFQINQESSNPPYLWRGVGGGFMLKMDSDIEEEAVKKAIQESKELVETSAADHQVKKAESLSASLDTLSGQTGPAAPPPTDPSVPTA